MVKSILTREKSCDGWHDLFRIIRAWSVNFNIHSTSMDQKHVHTGPRSGTRFVCRPVSRLFCVLSGCSPSAWQAKPPCLVTSQPRHGPPLRAFSKKREAAMVPARNNPYRGTRCLCQLVRRNRPGCPAQCRQEECPWMAVMELGRSK